MSRTEAFDFIQARLQARHGRRPGDDRWRLLESSTDLAGYLQQARGTALSPWVQHLSPQADAHLIEHSMRRIWRDYSAEIAGWAPAQWAPAILWIGSLPDLPFISHLARGGAVRPWMLQDPVLAPLALEDFQRRLESLAESPLSGVAESVRRGGSPVESWLDAWEATWPSAARGAGFQNLRILFGRHIANILAEPGAQPSGPKLRAQLAERLTAIFRRESGRIGAVFAHLGLMLVDVERLRGGLVLRALFTDPLERPRWA